VGIPHVCTDFAKIRIRIDKKLGSLLLNHR